MSIAGSLAGTLLGLLVVQSVLAGLLALPLSALGLLLPSPIRDTLRAGGALLVQLAALPLGALGSCLLYLRATRDGLRTKRLAIETGAFPPDAGAQCVGVPGVSSLRPVAAQVWERSALTGTELRDAVGSSARAACWAKSNVHCAWNA